MSRFLPGIRKFFYYNGLSITLASLFLLFWMGQAWAGWKTYNEERAHFAQAPVTLGAYLRSGHFWQATGENWESEFLQMGAYVLLTCYLFQKGSAESKDPDDPEKEQKEKAGFLYRNSLSLALFTLFAISFALHAEGGLRAANEERARFGLAALSRVQWLTDAEFWFQSLQNWQSEFLAVLSIVILSIFLRQHDSPESKKVDAPHGKTGR